MNPDADAPSAPPTLPTPAFSRWQDFPLAGSVLLEANAGTGKTHALVHWVLRLLVEQRAPIEQVLVVTFTERACQELRDRLTRILEQAECLLDTEVGQVSDAHRELHTYLQRMQVEQGHEALRLRLRLARQSADLAQVRTIHGFCQQALAEFAALQPERLVSLQSLLLDSVRQFWRHLLIREQHQPVPLHALYASPEALADEARPLAEQMLKPPVEVPDPTDDLAALVAQAKRLDSHRSWLQQHALIKTGSMLKAPGRDATAAMLGVVERQAWHELLSLKPIKRDEFFMQKATPEQQQAPALQAVLQFDSDRLAIIHRLRARLLQQVLVAFWDQRNRSREQERVFCFEDFINLMCQRVQRDPAFRQAVASRYRHCLIDEFQDTDQRQLDIFRRLFVAPLDTDEPRLLGMIGDPKQSIYRFRGADLEVYLRQRDQPGLRQGQLSRNFRSRQAVVQSVNRIFGHEQAFLSAALRLQPSDWARNPSWQDRLHPNAEAALLQVEIEQGDPLEAAAEWLSQALTQQRFVGEQALRAADCAILVRRNSEAEILVRALAQRGLAANVRRRSSVLESAAAADLQCLLQGLDEHAEPAVRRAAWSTPWLGLDAAECLQVPEPLAQGLLQRMNTLRAHIARDGLSSALAEALPAASAQALRMGLGAQWQVDSEHLLSLLAPVSASVAAGLHALSVLNASLLDGEVPEDLAARPASLADAVTVATVHAAKGLEFPVVLLPAMGKETSQNRPRWRLAGRHADELGRESDADSDTAARAEARRMAYVALTRASMMNVLFQSAKGDAGLLDAVVQGQAPDWKTFLQSTEQDAAGLFVQETFALTAITRQSLAQGPLQALARQTPSAPWQVASFSSLLGRHRASDPASPTYEGPAADERDSRGLGSPEPLAADPAPDADPELALLAQARGTAFGDIVHGLLEAALLSPQRWPSEPALREAQATLDATESGPAVPRGALAKLLKRILSTPLPGLPALAALPPGQFAVEFSFDLHIPAFRAIALADLLDQHGYDDAAAVLRAADDWQGFLTGSADLLIEHQGRFYVCDYKSNWLGPSRQDYRREALAQAMRAGHYRLQYLIYWLALHRHLRQRLGARYQPAAQIGGAIYLFVRAMGLTLPEQPHDLGQILEPVAPALIEAMSELLSAEVAHVD